MQTIYLDISNRGVIPFIYAKQNDVGRKVEVVLTNSGLPYEPEAGSVFSAWYSGASGTGNYTDIGDHTAFSVSGNKVTVELITQMLQNPGEGFLCLVLSRANGEQIGLWNIRYICEGIPGAGSESAKDYYSAFSKAVSELSYPDASLSVAGKAADAAATGNALAGKAPAGYGLGEVSGKYVTSPDEITESGIYRGAGPDGMFDVAWYLCISYTNQYKTLIAFNNISGGVALMRTMNNGTWGEWEWVNPPMVPGVEYRTTERWNGKAVYAKLVDFGTLPSNAAKTVATGSTADKIVSFVGIVTSASGARYTFPMVSNGALSSYAYISSSSGAIGVTSLSSMSGYTAQFIVKYVKD